MKPMKIAMVVSLLFLILSYALADEYKQRIAGAGPSTKIVELFVSEFTKLPAVAKYRFNVPKNSAKHAGGIKNSDTFLFGRTGRPLKDSEKAMGKDEIFLARIPIAFASSAGTGVEKITLAQMEGIYTAGITHRSEIGGPEEAIMLLGREPTEALFSVMKKDYPFFKDAAFDKILKNDNQMINLLKSKLTTHAMGFGALPNLKDQHIITVEGFSSGVSLGLVFDAKNATHPMVKAAKEFAASNAWADVLTSRTEALPPQ